MEDLFADYPDLARIYAVIGSISSSWSHLELSVNSTLWILAGVDHHQGACLTSQIPSMRNRVHALLALLKLNGFSPELVKRVNKFSDSADKIARKRNRVIHDPISAPPGKIEAVKISAEKELLYQFNESPMEEYASIDREISLLHKSYLEIKESIFAERKERAALAFNLISSNKENGTASDSSE